MLRGPKTFKLKTIIDSIIAKNTRTKKTNNNKYTSNQNGR